MSDINAITLDDMNYFWSPNGAPCFIASNWSEMNDSICDVIEGFGFQIYYLICDKSIPKEVTSKDAKGVVTPLTTYTYEPAVLKVVNNLMGRAVMDSPEYFGNQFAAVQEEATYSMPPIPRSIIDKLDEFFRLIHSQHGTESIVILTYEPEKAGSDGWGVLVPEQENTSVHCKYDADSIALLKPDHVIIVGSVHSHPDMPAYASGTDHDDQADFDGIHITYGWQKNVSGGATQYHIEFQIGGSAYTLKPEDVFQYGSTKEPDPDVLEWSTKVKKALPLYTSTGVLGLSASAVQNTTHQANLQHILPGTTSYNRADFISKLGTIEKDAVVAFEYDITSSPYGVECPLCSVPLSHIDLNAGFCTTCDTPMISAELAHFEIIDHIYGYCITRKIDATVAYYVYCVDRDNPSINFLINIKPSHTAPDLNDSLVPDDNDNYVSILEEIGAEYTLCCNILRSEMANCICDRLVLEEDIADFDIAHKQLDIYSSASNCSNCINFYQSSCPAFKNAVVDFITNGTILTENIETCDAFCDYKNNSYESYQTYGSYYD